MDGQQPGMVKSFVSSAIGTGFFLRNSVDMSVERRCVSRTCRIQCHQSGYEMGILVIQVWFNNILVVITGISSEIMI